MTVINIIRRTCWTRNLLSLRSKREVFQNHSFCRCISTGDEKRDTASVKQQAPSVPTESSPKNWISYGYDDKNQEIDTNAAHSTMFFSVTLCLVIGGFFFTYLPDYQLKDWAQREAYLQLRHKEQNGLPLVDPNYTDPSKMELPSDEELADTSIII